jgi:hypothetical protein
MAKILVISDDGQASAEVTDSALEGEEPWYQYACDCTAVRVRGDLADTIVAAVAHLDHHPVHVVRPPVVGG